MATNFQAKVSDELYETLDKLKSNFDGTAGQFVERMVEAYQLSQLKYGDSLLKEEIETLESLTNRINNLLISADEKVRTRLEDKEIEAAKAQEENQLSIKEKREKIQELEAERLELKTKLGLEEEARKKLEGEVKELQKQSSIAEDLVVEYKGKNDMLLSDLKEYKEDREENKKLKIQIQEQEVLYKEETQKLLDQLKGLDEVISTLNKENASLKERHARDIEDLESKHSRTLEDVQLKADMKLEKELRALESSLTQKHMKETNDIRQNWMQETSDLKENHRKELSILYQKLAEAETLRKQAVLEVKEEYAEKIQKLQDVIFELKTGKVEKEDK